MTSNTFCRHLSNGYRIFIRNGKISWMPCCYWTGVELPWQDLDQQRKQLNNSQPWAHRECSKCRKEEQYKTENYRAAGNKHIAELPDTQVGWLDIQADITCNGGCLICGPWNSSYWQNELARYKEYTLMPVEKTLKQSVDEIFQALDVSQLGLLQFLGGEPFLSDVDEYALEYITHPEICKLKYTTNGSVYPKQNRIERWQDFREVLINFSIDGIGTKFEYLRHPLKWATVEHNIKRLINESIPNMKFHINHTITPLNIYYYDEFLNWVEQTFPPERLTGTHTHTAYGVMSVANTPERVRTLVREKYGADHTLSLMLESHPLPSDTANFWNYINLWDQRRSTDWRQTFSEIID